MARLSLALWILLATASCGSTAGRPDSGSGTGGSSGGVPLTGLGGMAVGGSSGGGAAGTGSGGGAAGAGSGGVGAARIIRGDSNRTTWFSLTIEGSGFTNDEGKLVTARIGMPARPPERLGSAQVRIQDGAFRIEFPQGCEGDLYKQKVLFIDVDGDGSCTPGIDRVYVDFRFLEQDITLGLSDSVPAPATDRQMLRRSTVASSADPYCQALNEPWPDL